jgi:rSAM/selenodomain-associated transferase 2
VTLSIVVPVLDEADRLESFLAELARECPGAEVIVADGGSRDGSAAIAACAPGVRLVSSERGRACQMNAGAAAATGEILLFLHADTRLPPGAVDAVRLALGDPAVAYGRFDVRFDHPGMAFRLIAALMNLRSRLTGICTGDQAIFVGRARFERLGGYPEIPLMEDVELTRRLKRAGRLAPLGLRVTTSARRWERDGVARTIVLMWTLRFLHVCGVDPARLGRWYHGVPPGIEPEGRISSGGASERADAPRASAATGSSPRHGSPGAPPAPRAG